jgi:3-hydroxyisobutyrate dehydrogenase-like beta-hydroxyacid dehydrogenase
VRVISTSQPPGDLQTDSRLVVKVERLVGGHRERRGTDRHNGPMDEANRTVIAVLHPGDMGAIAGRCLVDAGYRVLWASQGRGEETRARAKAAGLEDAGTVADAARQADVVVSICPPHAALDVARSVRGFTGLYVDANAISPRTAAEVAAIVTSAGATYADGGIIGPPPAKPGTTRLYLSGAGAGAVAELFARTPLDARVVAAGPYAASAMKMAYAAWSKGSIAMLLATRALAEANGITEPLLEEWALSQPGLADRVTGSARSTSVKGWRWVAEMEEIGATMAAAGLPEGFYDAAAEVFRRTSVSGTDADDPADAVARVITAITRQTPPD